MSGWQPPAGHDPRQQQQAPGQWPPPQHQPPMRHLVQAPPAPPGPADSQPPQIVGSMSLDVQDRVAVEVAAQFPPDPREARIVDRRSETSHGYRAVHVVATLDGVSIGVQVRTVLQHLWADLMERLADRLGRQIRYGGEPVPPPGTAVEAAKAIIGVMMRLSADWAERETAADHVHVDAGEMTHLDRIADEAWNTTPEKMMTEAAYRCHDCSHSGSTRRTR